jgi:hypothetical protein
LPKNSSTTGTLLTGKQRKIKTSKSDALFRLPVSHFPVVCNFLGKARFSRLSLKFTSFQYTNTPAPEIDDRDASDSPEIPE